MFTYFYHWADMLDKSLSKLDYVVNVHVLEYFYCCDKSLFSVGKL